MDCLQTQPAKPPDSTNASRQSVVRIASLAAEADLLHRSSKPEIEARLLVDLKTVALVGDDAALEALDGREHPGRSSGDRRQDVLVLERIAERAGAALSEIHVADPSADHERVSGSVGVHAYRAADQASEVLDHAVH